MKLVSISGLDSSGKSTQIEMLKNYLELQGKKVFYYHAIQHGITNKFSKNKSGEAKSVTEASWPKIILRRIFLMVDILRFKSLCKKLEKENCDYLVSDRYFYDSIINIKYLSGKDKKLPCENFIIKPDVSIYLKADPEIIMQRERKPDQGLEYLQDKKKLYEKAAGIWNMRIIDGNRGKEEIFEEIKNLCQIT